MSDRKGASGYLSSLTGLRGFAALLVFFHHYFTKHFQGWYSHPTPAKQIIAEGHVGVAVFFALSGFLIFHRYQGRLDGAGKGLLSYLVKRFARIYPLYAVLLSLKLAFGPVKATFVQALVLFALLQTHDRISHDIALFPAWTLSIEAAFYVLSALLMIAMAKGDRLARGVPAFFAAPAISIPLAALAIAGAGGLIAPYLQGTADEQLKTAFLYNIYGYFAHFGIGALAACLVRKLPKPEGIATVTPLLFLAGLGLIYLSLLEFKDGRESFSNFAYLSAYGIASLGSALIILAAFWQDRLVAAIFGNPISEYLGKISFALYLLQETFFATWIYKLSAPVMRTDPLTEETPFLALCAFLFFSALAYELIEKPAQRWIVSLAARRLDPLSPLDVGSGKVVPFRKRSKVKTRRVPKSERK